MARYRKLKAGEVIKKGDEYCSKAHNEWHPSVLIGVSIRKCGIGTYRRKVKAKPRPKYRMLKEGEVIKNGDEVFYSSSQKWMPTNSAGCITHEGDVGFYRRKVEPKAKVEKKPEPKPAPGPEFITNTEYRYLSKGETVVPGDEYLENGVWKRFKKGTSVAAILDWRRPYTKTYRILDPEEIIEEGDEFQSSTLQWSETNSMGDKVSSQISPGGIQRYRRPVTTTVDVAPAAPIVPVPKDETIARLEKEVAELKNKLKAGVAFMEKLAKE